MGSKFDFTMLTKRRLQKELFETLPKGKWYVAVVDKPSLQVLSSHMKMSDLLEYNISVIDPLELTRKEGRDAVYFICPLMSSVNRIIEDFQRPKPLYDNAHIFFTSKASEKVLTAIKACQPLVNRLAALKEIHTEFVGVDPRVFVTADPNALQTFFGHHMELERRDQELRKAAQRLATVFTTLKARPASVTVHTPQDLPDLVGRESRAEVCRDLAREVLERLSKWGMRDSSLFSGPACDLLILDRAHDPVAPIIHPFHYAPITHDLLRLENNVFRYTWQDAKGADQKSEHLVDTSDEMWEETRHEHIADVAGKAASRLREFGGSKLARVEREGAAQADLGKATQSLPEYLAKKARLSMHVELTRCIFDEIDRRDLIPLGRLEQELVFGEKKSRDIITALQAWNAGRGTGTPTAADKMRLLLSYVATHPGKMDPKNQESWATVGQFSARDMHTICNIQYLGVELARAKSSTFSFTRRGKGKKAIRMDRSARDAALENGRFQPLLHETFGDFMAGKLLPGPGREWDVLKGNSEFDTAAGGADGGAPSGAKSMRTTAASGRTPGRAAPTWHKTANSLSGIDLDSVSIRNRVVVVFVVGGCTWTEIQAAHELSAEHGVDVILGSTHVIERGEDFLAQLASLSPFERDHLALEMEGRR